MSSFEAGLHGAKITTFVPQILEDDAKHLEPIAFITKQEASTRPDFEIDPQISSYIGLDEAKNREEKKKFDTEVLRYVQRIKDDAYQEAYQLGLAQGAEDAKVQALADAKEAIEQQASTIIELTNKLSETRQIAYEANQKEIIEFCYLMAKKIALKEIQKDPTVVLSAIEQVANQREAIKVRLASADYEFLQNSLGVLGARMDLSKIRFEKDEALQRGDIFVSSEQGWVDGTLATRLTKLKQLLDSLE